MQSLRGWMLGGLVAVLLATVPSWADGQVYTVGGDTGMTITDGVAKLQPGDTLRILPGTYHTMINVPCDNVTIEGAGPGVILEGAVTLTAADLTPAADRPGVYTWQLPAEAVNTQIPWIFYKGKPMVFTKAALNPAKQAWCFFVDQQTRQLEVVFDGKGIPAGASIVVPTLASLVHAWGRKQVTIRGLEVYRSVGDGINCEQGTVEDNLVMFTGLWGILGGEKSTIIRNTVKWCNGPGVVMHGNSANVENNLIVANGAQYAVYTTWSTANVKINAISNCTFQLNWILDRPKGGLVTFDGQSALNDGKPVLRTSLPVLGMWPDTDSFNNNYIENAVARQSHAGIYIEAACNRNVVMANDVQDCAMGITLRTSADGTVTRNWVWDRESLGWGTVDKEGFCGYGPGYHDDGTPVTQSCFDVPWTEKLNYKNMVITYDPNPGAEMYGRQILDGLCLWQTIITPKIDWCDESTNNNLLADNLVQVSGMSVSVPLYQREWPSAAERKQIPPLTTFTNQLTDNYYTLPAQQQDVALLGHTKVKTFATYQQMTGWDANAHVGNYTPAVLRLEPIWTIPGLAVDDQTPVSILHDPSLETMGLYGNNEPLFWHASTADNWSDTAPVAYCNRDLTKAHSGRVYISVTNTMDATLDRPLGWYSSAIPVKPGITMAVNLWMAADAINAAKAGTGARVSFRFTDSTGHLVSAVPVVGDGVHPELLTGTYKWTNVGGQAVVPAGAYWMTIYLGDDHSTGTVRYDDIHINMRNPVPPQFPWVK